MKLEEFLAFKGEATQIQEYQKLLDRGVYLDKKIRTLSNKIQDEQDSIEVLQNPQNDRERELLQKHTITLDKLIKSRDYAYTKREQVLQDIRTFR